MLSVDTRRPQDRNVQVTQSNPGSISGVSASGSGGSVSVGGYNPGTISGVSSNYGAYPGSTGNPQQSSGGFQTTGNTQNVWGGSQTELWPGAATGGSGTNTVESQVPGASGSGSSFKDTSAARSATQQALDALGTSLDTSYGNIDSEYGDLISDYDLDVGRVNQDYDRESGTNTNNLLRNRQNALMAAAQGRRGLRGTLASLGALSGDGSFLADQAVTTAANSDLGGAQDAYKTNFTNLETAKTRFEEDDLKRRQDAEAAKEGQREVARRENLERRQTLLEKLASLFSDAGMNNEAAQYLSQSGGLNQEIASLGGVIGSAFTPGQAQFSPAALENYLAGAGDMSVRVQGGDNGAIGGPAPVAGRFGDERKRNQA